MNHEEESEYSGLFLGLNKIDLLGIFSMTLFGLILEGYQLIVIRGFVPAIRGWAYAASLTGQTSIAGSAE